MSVQFRTYRNETRFGADYHKLRSFLVELDDCNYSFGRWDWMITHTYLQEERLSEIGIWEDGGRIVALAAFDTVMDGKCFFPYREHYGCLFGDMIAYAKDKLTKDGKARMLIRDSDEAFQAAASAMGLLPTQEKDCDAVFPIGQEIRYSLPDGFSVTDMGENPDFYRYGEALWKGFNHELDGEGSFSPGPGDLLAIKNGFERPNINPRLKIAVVAPNGDFVSYCGMWQDSACQSAIAEPVATDPAYRRLGLGRAAVLEGIRRCGELGAKRAFVGSSQQFYYQIGFRPCATSTFWG